MLSKPDWCCNEIHKISYIVLSLPVVLKQCCVTITQDEQCCENLARNFSLRVS